MTSSESTSQSSALMTVEAAAILQQQPSAAATSAFLAPARTLRASASPFRLVVDPVMRADLKKGLFELIDHHDNALAAYVGENKLALDSYKEYIELFARSLRETMDSREGVLYLLKCAGVELGEEQINLQPDWRWK